MNLNKRVKRTLPETIEHARTPLEDHRMDRSMRRLFRMERACDGHHVIARRSSAHRHRQGPKAARMRGRSEAQRLARCRAQMQHRRRDGRRVDVIPTCSAPVTPASRPRNAARLKPRFPDRTAQANARERDQFAVNIFRTNRTGSSGESESQSSAFDAADTRRFSPPNMRCQTIEATETAMA